MMSTEMSVVIVLLCVFLSPNRGQVHMAREGVSFLDGTGDSGWLQLTYDGDSGLLCAEDVGREEARVACRDLGLPYQYPSLRAQQAPHGSHFLGSNLQCQGDEIKLSDCHHDPWGTGACPHHQAVYLSCRDDPCVPNPCQNDGVCVLASTELGYQCNCTSAWSGLLCSTDVNECLVSNGGCSDLCVNVDGGYSCQCPQPQLVLGPDNHTCTAPGEEVVCESDAMVLTLEKARFPSLHREHLTLSDPACGASENATHIILTAPLSACGTTSQQSGTTIVYKNVVHSQEEVVQGVITRVKDVEIPFQCVMTLDEVKEIPIQVDTSELHFLLEGTGTHDVNLNFSTTGHFPGQGQVSVYPGQQIYGQVTLTTVDPNLRVALSNCSATTTYAHNATVTPYPLLERGCPQDSTLFLANVTDSTHQGFHMEAFKFLDNTQQVVVHCDIVLCDEADLNSFCRQGCPAALNTTITP